MPDDERATIALNFAPGICRRSKGVVYHYRGAYLVALGGAAARQVPHYPDYLSVVPTLRRRRPLWKRLRQWA
ncbi:hypothetical protein [Leisingera sp. F5]|uniref:hypothetical protein n=1 Tax=Leisingera sp. F5 TaxID=1813816 RepID=UPI000A939194|nr:hypothetical protein [Leisingera sp. F5]